jgi:hypothetical protein
MTPAIWTTLSTVRLESEKAEGRTSVGTGYFYTFVEDQDGQKVHAPMIVTNKHVIQGSQRLTIVCQVMPEGAQIQNDGSAPGEMQFPMVYIGVEGVAVNHPNPDIDLCAIPVVHLFRPGALPAGYVLKAMVIEKEGRLTADEAADLGPIEPIVMVGYPNGLWDQQNNRPLVRRGLTASHALRHWNGSRVFVIDAACFPGSSGSPVFLFEDGLVRRGGGYSPGSRAKLLGTLYAGPQVNAEGRLEARPIPTAVEAVPVVAMMMNLGYVVHADALDDLQAEYRGRMMLNAEVVPA